MGALPPSLPCLPLFSRPPPSARTPLPPFRARARAPDRRTDGGDGRHNGVSLSPLSRLCRRRRRRSLSPSFGSCPFAVRSFVRSVGLGEPFRPHVWPSRPSARQDQTSSSVEHQAHQDQSVPPRSVIPRGAHPHPPAHDADAAALSLSARQVRGPRKPKPKFHPEEPVCTSAFSGHHCTSFFVTV